MVFDIAEDILSMLDFKFMAIRFLDSAHSTLKLATRLSLIPPRPSLATTFQ